jgi:hypothetical protein
MRSRNSCFRDQAETHTCLEDEPPPDTYFLLENTNGFVTA